MIPIKEYYCSSAPTKEELIEAHEITIKENCVVHLKWFVQYSGWYERYVYSNSNIEEMYNELKFIVYSL